MPPRGSLEMVGALLTEPVTPGAHAGVLFLDGRGWPPFSGHGLMAVAALAVERGLVTVGDEPAPNLLVDTLAGSVPVRIEVVRAKGEEGSLAPRVARVSYQGPAARVIAGGLPVGLAGRSIHVDLASCAGLFAIADGESAGVPLSSDRLPELRRAATLVREAIEPHVRRALKNQREDEAVSVVFIGPSDAGASDLRSAAVAPGGQVSLSPSGRTTAAIVSVLDAMGVLPDDRPFRNEGLLGLALEGRVVRRSTDDPPLLTVEISGTAWPTGDHEFVFRAGDPFLSASAP
jgi:proline racemase